MTDTAPLTRIKDKPFSQRSKIEECILLVWEEDGLESTAYKAAEQLEALTATPPAPDAGLVALVKSIEAAKKQSDISRQSATTDNSYYVLYRSFYERVMAAVAELTPAPTWRIEYYGQSNGQRETAEIPAATADEALAILRADADQKWCVGQVIGAPQRVTK